MKRIAVPAVVVVAAAALVALLVYGLAARGESRSLDDATTRGDRVAAPDRSLPVLGQPGQRSLASFRPKVVVLNFWASWCTPCRLESPLLERFQREIAPRGGTVVGVGFRDAEPDALAFVRRYDLTYPTLRDVEGRLARAYGTNQLPETFVLDRRGRVSALQRGPVDRPFLERTVNPLLSEPA